MRSVASYRGSSRRFRVFGLTLGVGAIAVATALSLTGGAPALGPLVVFGGLVAFTENRSVTFPDGTTMSASSVPVMAAVVIFHAQGAPAGAMIVSMCGALYLPALRGRDVSRILFNAGSYGFATLVVSLTYAALATATGAAGLALLVVAVPVALVDLVLNDLFVAVAMAVSGGRSVRSCLRRFRPGSWQVVPFTVLGLVMGCVWVEFGAATLPLFVVPVVVAHRTFHAYEELRRAHEATLETLLRALEAKDGATARHVRRVAVYAGIIGEELGLSPARLERLRCAALMHDVGKLAVPSELLNKPGRLTPEEFRLVHRHEEVSVEILERITFLRDIAPSASSAHSRYDGADPASVDSDATNGEPGRSRSNRRNAESGRRSRTALLEPHIVHVADAFDAMTSTRAYRRALDRDVALDELRRYAGSQFHPLCVEALEAALQRRSPEAPEACEEAASEAILRAAGAPPAVERFPVTPPARGTGSAGLGDLAGAGA